MGTELLATVVDSVDPTWIGAMLYTYPVQFIVWTAIIAAVAFALGFAWEKRKVGIANAEADLMRTQHDIDVETMRSVQEANKELHAFNKKLIDELGEANKQLAKSVEQNEKLIQEIELTR